MAYPNYYPQFYPNMMPTIQNQQQMAQNVPQQSSNGITWVQGENAAKSYPVAAGQSILLMDSEDSVMYIKSTDQSGMPLPLRIFDYTERKTDHTEPEVINKTASADYVSRSEFDEFKEDIKRSLKSFKRPIKKDEEE